MREKRDEIIILRTTKAEKNRIYEKMLGMGIRSLSAYIRKMALDGYCLNLDLPQLRRMAYGTSLQMPMIKASGRKGKSVDCLHSDEVEALQAALQECSMLEKTIILCLLNTGVRRGELAGLTWKDVNFCDGTIHVSKSLLVFPNYGYQLTTTKESNIRDVDVAPEFMAFLKDYHEQWKSRKS